MGIDHMWILICACFIFFMQAGFVCYEVGFVQSKNVISVAMENMFSFVVASLSFYFIGFAIMYGQSLHGLLGTSHVLLSNLKNSYDYIFIFYEMMFAATSVTIFSGSMSERTKLSALVAAEVIVGTLIYPVFGHWVWGGVYIEQATFLSKLGYMDFAGATVVHATAGWIALAGVIVVGPRKDRFDEDGKPKRLGRSNIPFATIGTFILWFSWFGFNGGNLLKFSDSIGLILLNTSISASAGVGGALIATYLFAKDQSYMEAIFSGALGGLVAITAGSNILKPFSAGAVGMITGCVVVMGSKLLLKLKIDDVVNAVPIHAFGGICGTVLCVLFAAPEDLRLPSKAAQVMVQLLGVTVNFLWAFGMGYLTFYVINKTLGLRVSEEEEENGLNIAEFSDIYSWHQKLVEDHYEDLTQNLSDTIEMQNAQLKRQASMLAVTQEREREKIARDLHDGVGQSLVALKINLGLIKKQTNDDAQIAQVDKTIRLAESTIEEIRNVIYNLKPVELNRDGLSKSIRQLCDKLREISGIEFTCDIKNELPEWSETENLNIYRIVQECLTNIIKHSGAKKAQIDIFAPNDKLYVVSISDDGVGFDTAGVNSGFGLSTIQQRAAILNAKVKIVSREGRGTRVILEVPYAQN
jgi:Amt family ammonium transporter